MDDATLTRRSHAILKLVVDAPRGDQAALVDEACAGDDRLRRRVLTLVAALDETQGFLETPALERSRNGPQPEIRQPPAEIGGYRIVGVIGTGGMATVYEAVQENPSRRVALKVLRFGLAHTSALHRFVFETEVLARLRHPGIAQIYEAGTHDDGHGASIPFFAMEHIANARRLTEYADDRGLDLRGRLLLFTEVCDAVQHGHQNGVIHRDLKPSNVLVDGAGVPKVIDFGVARSTDPEQAWITRQSDVGQLVGTLNYMSPEQCAADQTVDARADVYSLGVMLYELLCGRLPHDLSGVPVPEALRIVRMEAPARPSAVNPELRGDIEAILLMAIEKDPERRYRSVAALATDIQRSLRSEMIEARPPTLMYQCRLFARRNRGLVGAIGAVAAVLLISAIVSAGFAIRATREARARHAAEITAIAERDHAVWRSYIASIAASLSAYQSNDVYAVRRRLDDAPAQHRGWEWRFLDATADRSLRVVTAHDDMVFGFAPSPDRARIATCGRDGGVAIWNAQTGERLATAAKHASSALCVAFSPDGDQIVTGSTDGAMFVSDAATGALRRLIDSVGDSVLSVAFGPGDVIAAAISGRPAVLRSAETGEPLRELDDQPAIRHVAFSPDGRTLATASEQDEIRLRNADTCEPVHTLSVPGVIGGLAFSDDGGLIAAGADEGRITIFRTDTGERVFNLRTPQSLALVRALNFSPSADRLASGHGDRTITLWSIAGDAPTILAQLRGHAQGVSGVAFSPDASLITSSAWDRTIRLWGVADHDLAEPIPTLRGHADRVIAVRFAPDSSFLATSSNDGDVRLWDPDLGQCLGALRGHTGPVFGLAFSPDGRRIATSSHDDTVRIWSARTGALERALDDHTDDVWTVGFSPDGRLLASGSDDKTIRVRAAPSWKTQRTLTGHTERVTCLAFAPDGDTIASTSRDQTVRLWSASSGELHHVCNGHGADVFSVLFSPDGALVYSGSRDGAVRVWSAATGEPIDVMEAPGQFVTSLSLSRDGARLAAGSWLGEIMLWDLNSRDMVASFKGHNSAIRGVSFSPDDRWLAATSYEWTTRLFDTAPPAQRAQLRAEAARASADADLAVERLLAEHGDTDRAAAAIDAAADHTTPWRRKAILRRALASQPH